MILEIHVVVAVTMEEAMENQQLAKISIAAVLIILKPIVLMNMHLGWIKIANNIVEIAIMEEIVQLAKIRKKAVLPGLKTTTVQILPILNLWLKIARNPVENAMVAQLAKISIAAVLTILKATVLMNMPLGWRKIARNLVENVKRARVYYLVSKIELILNCQFF